MWLRFSKLFLLLCLLYNISSAQWKNVKSFSIGFKIRNAGIGVDGVFTKGKIQAYVDEGDPTRSTFQGSAEAASISTGIKLRDTHLKEKDDFFAAAKYPELTMRSVSVVPKSKGVYTVTWDLRIKSISRRFSSDVQVVTEGEQLRLISEFKIDRNDWKLGGSSLTMSDKVNVKISAVLSK